MLPDYYKVLDVSPDSSKDEVTKAYRRHAKRYHPDMNEAPNAHHLFIAVHEAYEVLRNEDRRRQYDELYHSYYMKEAEPEHSEEYYEQAFASATEQGRAEGEKYAADYKLFSEKVLRGAAGMLFLELFIAVIFLDATGSGFLLGLVALVGGVFVTFGGVDPLSYAQIGCGLLMMVVGFLILRYELRKIAEDRE